MKKILLILASLALLVGVVGSAQAGSSSARPSKNALTTKAPTALSASKRAADLSKLANKHLSSKQLKALGLRKASPQQVARIKQLQKSSKAAKTSHVGPYAWFTRQYAGNTWQDVRYSGPYYSGYWSPYYVIYDNFKTCTNSGTGCIDADAYTYQYLLRWSPNNTYYYYGPSGYSTGHQAVGYGPYFG